MLHMLNIHLNYTLTNWHAYFTAPKLRAPQLKRKRASLNRKARQCRQ